MFDLYRAEDLINQQEILITLIQNKMKDEFIIINKTAIEKIDELIKEANAGKTISSINSRMAESLIRFKQQLLSQSTPLIPEIEKAFEAGENNIDNDGCHIDKEGKQDYISNLKLDI